jgi:hypothetical protein
MWFHFNSVSTSMCWNSPTNWGVVLRDNTVQHTFVYSSNMSLDVHGNILDQQALSLDWVQQHSQNSAHSNSCNRVTTLLPWNFSYIWVCLKIWPNVDGEWIMFIHFPH